MKTLLLLLFLAGCQQSEVTVKEYKQNQMVNGCVMQKSNDQWIRTCG
jgi:PBP1b-binding outer membrane lipoprotein LpoB